MVRLEEVYKTYRQGSQPVPALRGVDLHIEDPGFYAVMGPSGSGKSTLLYLLAGLDRADTGRVMVNQTDLGTLSESKLSSFRRRNIGIVFQQYNLIPTLTAQQNIALPGVLDGRPGPWIKRRVDELLERLHLKDRASHRPDALSGGEQQRVAIARALVFEPSVMLADEPTGALDSASSERLWQLLGELAEHPQMMVLMVTHEPAAAAHCQRVVVLNDGQTRGMFDVDSTDESHLVSRYQQLGG